MYYIIKIQDLIFLHTIDLNIFMICNIFYLIHLEDSNFFFYSHSVIIYNYKLQSKVFTYLLYVKMNSKV